MSFTRAQWSRDMLISAGNTSPTQTSIDFVVGWSVHETNTNSGARYNLLNTTLRVDSTDTDFNSVGVKNFASYALGTDANARTLANGRYPKLYLALATNDANALLSPTTEMRSELGVWGTGGSAAGSFVNLGKSHENDTFDYGNTQKVQPNTTDLNPNGSTQGSNGGGLLGTGTSSILDWLNPMFVGKMCIGVGLVFIGVIQLQKGK